MAAGPAGAASMAGPKTWRRTMSITDLKQFLPDYAKDIRLNLSSVLRKEGAPGLSETQILGTALASALATDNAEFARQVEQIVSKDLDEATRGAARAAASIMAMNNVYYRFLHLVEDAEYAKLPAGLRMQVVGNPGVDKVDFELYSLAAVHDASLMGTSAQWSSARESTPLQLIKRAGKASVGIIWDEIEKVGTRTENGNALEALLPLLEIDQAKRFRDLALEVECDLSAVSHFATANSLEGVPSPLRDRMRVLTMPTPTWEHISVLSRQIIDRVAKERGIDPRFFEPLAQDEIDLIKAAWPGGSLRQLTRIVTTILDGREQIMGRA
jgi:AhpD family alkylhydroperoxidase